MTAPDSSPSWTISRCFSISFLVLLRVSSSLSKTWLRYGDSLFKFLCISWMTVYLHKQIICVDYLPQTRKAVGALRNGIKQWQCFQGICVRSDCCFIYYQPVCYIQPMLEISFLSSLFPPDNPGLCPFGQPHSVCGHQWLRWAASTWSRIQNMFVGTAGIAVFVNG